MLLLAITPQARAQDYFGRNKVQYESFNWRILKSDHFDNFFYPPESTIVHDAAAIRAANQTFPYNPIAIKER